MCTLNKEQVIKPGFVLEANIRLLLVISLSSDATIGIKRLTLRILTKRATSIISSESNLAPRGVFRAILLAQDYGSLLHCLFTLTPPFWINDISLRISKRAGRYLFCGTFLPESPSINLWATKDPVLQGTLPSGARTFLPDFTSGRPPWPALF